MLGTALAAGMILAGCGGGGGDAPVAVATTPHFAGDIFVPGMSGAAVGASFDLGIVTNNSPGPGRYYYTDRNNAAVDVVDIASGTLVGSVKGVGALAFKGFNAVNGLAGPDGIDQISPTKIYVGDVDSVKVMVPQVAAPGGTITKSIPATNMVVGDAGFRADEGCFDKDHNIYAISIPDAALPAVVYINTNTDTVIATVQITGGAFVGAAGNEACFYDSATQSFYFNNDGTTANPRGEVDVVPAASIYGLPGLSPTFVTNMGALAGVKRYPTLLCDPTGIVAGPGTDMLVECRPAGVGEKLVSLIYNKTNGALVGSVPFGGGDQVFYDPTSNRYAVAGSRWHSSGVNDKGGGCSATNPCVPTLGIIDAGSRALVATLPTGNNAHSVAVDPVTGEVFMPYSKATTPAGGVPTAGFGGNPAGGIIVFTIK